jgi:hypothetical protein
MKRILGSFIFFTSVIAFPVYAFSETGIAAITIPSADITLSLIQPG